MPQHPASRRHSHRKQMSGYFHSRAPGAYSPIPPPSIDSSLSTILPLSIGRPGTLGQSSMSDNSAASFNLHMALSADGMIFNRHSPASRHHHPPLACREEEHPRRKRTKSITTDHDYGQEAKRGEKWTEEEERLLRERRNGNPESWEETGKYFIGRTTNALQKKWKLMTLSDKMKIEPEVENKLLEAVDKHAPSFYRNLASEMKMAEDRVEDIEAKISILFMQGKLPRKSSLPSSRSVHRTISSPLLPTARPSSPPIARPYTVDHYRSLDASKPLAVSSYSHYQTYHDTIIMNSPLESPPIAEVYNSDTEESLYLQDDESGGALGDAGMSSFFETWTDNPHFDPSPFLMHEKSCTDNILGYSVYHGLDGTTTTDGVYPQ